MATTSHDRPFNEAVFLIIGATGGIGSLLSRELAGLGATLAIAARDDGRLATLAEELHGAVSMRKALDATHPGEVETFAGAVAAECGRLDGVVNLVGSILLKPAHLTTDDDWRETISLNLDSAFHALRAGAKSMKQGGSIVLLSSAAARVGLASHEAIAAAKAGVIGLTRSAAATYAPRGLRVNCVAPGLVRTPLSRRITENESALKASAAMHALGRIGEPADVVSAILWLLSPANTWTTGQIIGVDGGLATVRGRGSA